MYKEHAMQNYHIYEAIGRGRAAADAHPRCAPPPRSDFAAADARTLRASLSAFLDLLALCARTLEAYPSAAAQP